MKGSIKKQQQSNKPEELIDDGFAIIGMACRFPEADSLEEFWLNLINKKESITYFSKEQCLNAGESRNVVNDSNYVAAAPVLTGPEYFDASFFNYSPREARLLDPQHRIFIECAWEALEDACINPNRIHQEIGVYGGSGGLVSSYYSALMPCSHELVGDTGSLQHICNDKDYLTTRVSYKLNLTGPSITVQTACSTSLVAVHLACEALRHGECSIALAGGVTVRYPHIRGYLYHQEGIVSPDGHCRPFDAQAMGTVFGSGAGVIVLKPLKQALLDNDAIYAVIRGSAINNDGGQKFNYTSSSVDGHARVISKAIAAARVDAATIQYIEAHGTGTLMGDPLEVQAFAKAYSPQRTQKEKIAIGSVKGNIGHVEAASGIAGLIKTVLSLYHSKIPPTVNFSTPNPKINFVQSPFFINKDLIEWPDTQVPKRAGVSSLGIGGTNAHVILEETPLGIARPQKKRAAHCMMVSAKNKPALEEMVRHLHAWLINNTSVCISDVCASLQMGRVHFQHKLAFVVDSREQAIEVLENYMENKKQINVYSSLTAKVKNKSVFLFNDKPEDAMSTGHYLYQNDSYFKHTIDEFETLWPDKKKPLNQFLFDKKTNLDKEQFGQIAYYFLQLALAKQWQYWGITPDYVLGSGVGGVAAATYLGHLSTQDALLFLLENKLPLTSEFNSSISFICPETGNSAKANDFSDKSFWSQFSRDNIDFDKCVQSLYTHQVNTFIEIGGAASSLLDLIDSAYMDEKSYIIRTLLIGNTDDKKIICNLAKLHCLGYSIHWENYLKDVNFQKCHLPTYPWQKELFVISETKKPIVSDILTHLNEHRIKSKTVFPAVGFISEMVVAATESGKQSQICIKDFVIENMLLIEHYKMPVLKNDFEPANNRINLFTYDDIGNKSIHASACIVTEEKTEFKDSFQSSALSNLSSVKSTEFYSMLEKQGYGYGPYFQQIDTLWLDSKGVYAKLKACEDSKLSSMMPMQTEGALQTILAFILQHHHEVMYLPVGINSLHVLDPYRPVTWVQTTVDVPFSIGDEQIQANITCFDEAMNPVMLLSGVRFKKLGSSSKMQAGFEGVHDKDLSDSVSSRVIKHVSAILGISDNQLVVDKPLLDSGLDSLLAVELRNRLVNDFRIQLPSTIVFDAATTVGLIALIKQAYTEQIKNEPSSVAFEDKKEDSDDAIAIIGIACRFPGGADNPKAYWDLLAEGRDAVVDIPSSRWDWKDYYDTDINTPGKMYTHKGGFLQSDISAFDPDFFGISPREAIGMDPQQRLLLEVCYEALEDADKYKHRVKMTGVFMGLATYDYSQLQLYSQTLDDIDSYAFTGNAHSIAAGRISYVFGFQGPSVSIDTACSSSLVAMHLASQSLLRGECDLALAGGVNLMITPANTVYFCKAGALSRSGHCHTFSDHADGYVRGEGCGVIVLKRLKDALQDKDKIWGIIRGSAINQDGKSSGLTAPFGPAQVDLYRAALNAAQIQPTQVSYLEAHGTGTPLGDQIELQSINEVYGKERRSEEKLLVGSVKTNFGHLEAAAGVASVIKVLLSFRYNKIPSNLNFNPPNKEISWSEANIDVPTHTSDWPADRESRMAAISSFAFSGTNSHLILEEPPHEAAAPLPSEKTVPYNKKPYWIKEHNEPLADSFTQIKWYEQELPSLKETTITNKFALLYGSEPVADNLIGIMRQQGLDVLETGNLDSLDKDKLSELTVICMWPKQQTDISSWKTYCVSLLNLLKHSRPKHLILVSWGSRAIFDNESGLSPVQATLWGFGSVIFLEYPNIKLKRIDLDSNGDEAAQLNFLINEMTTANEEDMVACRGNQRFVPRLVKAPLLSPASPVTDKLFKADKTYILVGGLGALGRQLLGWLAQNGAQHIVVIDLPSLSKPVEEIERLQENGIQVEYFCCDIGDYDSLSKILTTIKNDMIPVAGVFQVAAAISDSLIKDMSEEQFAKVMPCKVEGTWNLHQLTLDLELDLFVLFSSVACVLGSPTQGNYAAANAYLETLAHYRRANGLPCLTVSWGPYTVGVGAHMGEGALQVMRSWGIKPLAPEMGLNALGYILKRPHEQWQDIGFFPIDWQVYSEQLGFDWHFISECVSGSKSKAKIESPDAHKEGKEESLSSLDGSEIEALVNHVLRREANEPLDHKLPLSEQGVDSLLGVEFINLVSKKVGHKFPVSLIFSYPTISVLERYLDTFVKQSNTAKKASSTTEFLLGNQLDLPLSDKLRFVNTATVRDLPYLNDHVVLEQVMWPAAASVKMLFEASRQCNLNEPIVIEALTFNAPIIFDEHVVCTFQLVLEKNGDSSFDASIWFKTNDADPWGMHAKAMLQEKPVPEVTELNTNDLLAQKHTTVSGETFYQLLSQRDWIKFGPRHQGLREIYRGDGWSLAKVSLPQSLKTDIHDAATLHPSILDACCQVSLALIDDLSTCPMYVTLGMDEIYLFNQFPDEFWVHGTLQETTDNQEKLKANITAYDLNGTPILTMIGYTLQAPKSTALVSKPTIGSDYYLIKWNLVSIDRATGMNHHFIAIMSTDPQNCEALCLALKNKGTDVIGVAFSSSFKKDAKFNYRFDFNEASHWDKFLSELREEGIVVSQFISVMPPKDESLTDVDVPNLSQAFTMIRSLMKHDENTKQNLVFITQSCQAVNENAALFPKDAAIWGLARVNNQENLNLNCRCIDVEKSSWNDTDLLADVLLSHLNENEYALRNGSIFVPRLTEYELDTDRKDQPYQIISTAAGLDNLKKTTLLRSPPGENEVEIQVAATSLNFKDVLISLGVLPEMENKLGVDCAGTVVSIGSEVKGFTIGDEVMALKSGSMASHVNVVQDLVYKLPKTINLQQGASLVCVTLTAYLGLIDYAKIKPGTHVLIHSAAGGVGLMAVQLAKQAGAVVYGTASPGKWEQVKQFGADHLMNSRNLDFADEIMRLTKGRGVDVVLNCLAGDYLEKSVELVAKDGYFLEIGKRNIKTYEEMKQLRPDIHYYVYDLLDYSIEHPEGIASMYEKVSELLEGKQIQSPPITTFSINQLRDAFTFMAGAKQVGKIVIEHDYSSFIKSNRSYLITGGLSGLGLRLASWLSQNGASHLVLMGRKGIQATEKDELDHLSNQGVTVLTLQVDVSNKKSLTEAMAIIDEKMPEIAGVFHLAGATNEGAIAFQNTDKFLTGMDAKVAGALNLHALTKDKRLDCFVLFSSIVSLIGNPGLSSYAAANTFMDSFSCYRQAHGLPALSIDWGPWIETGMVERLSDEYKSYWLNSGYKPIKVNQGFLALHQLLMQREAHVIYLPIDWQRFKDKNRYKQLPHLFTGFAIEGPEEKSETQLEELSKLIDELKDF